MNWKLISALSFLGLGMGIISVYWIPSKAEPFLWLPVFMLSAWLIARQAHRKFFLNGFVLGLMNCLWVTLVHIWLSAEYQAHHPAEALQYKKMEADGLALWQAMLFINLLMGFISAIALGLFALLADKAINKGRKRHHAHHHHHHHHNHTGEKRDVGKNL